MKYIDKIFKWNLEGFFKTIIGTLIFSVAINLFIVPNNLYSGGVLGISQLLRSMIVSIFKIVAPFDISSLFYYLINIPLFIIAYKNISKTFFSRTLLCVTVQFIALALIPIPDKPLVDNLLTNVLIGGILDGLGMGLILSAGASSGGTDIIGVALSSKKGTLSVGKIGMFINTIIYVISGILYGVETMIYSIIFSVFGTLMLDHTHEQNISSTAIIFTKKHPKEMIKYISEELSRDATYFEAIGGYTDTKTYITYVALSKYELSRLTRHMKDFDDKAFLIKQDGVGVHGEFEKHIIN